MTSACIERSGARRRMARTVVAEYTLPINMVMAGYTPPARAARCSPCRADRSTLWRRVALSAERY